MFGTVVDSDRSCADGICIEINNAPLPVTFHMAQEMGKGDLVLAVSYCLIASNMALKVVL